MRPIAYVVHVRTPGATGGEARSYQVAQALGSIGLEVHLYGDVDRTFAWHPLVHPHVLRHPTPLGFVQLLRDFARNRVTVAVERYHFPPFNVGFMAQESRNRPTIFEVHGFPIDELRQPQLSGAIGLYAGSLARVPRRVWDTMQAAMFRRAAHIIVTSSGTKSILAGMGVPDERISVIYNCVEPARFDPEVVDREAARSALGLPEDADLVLYAGTLRHETVPLLADAAARVLAVRPNVRFVCALKGPSQSLIDEARVRGLPAATFLVRPPVPHANMPSLVAACDLLLAPYDLGSSMFRVGFHYSPLKVLEALAMEKAVVTVDVDELRRVFGALPNVIFADSGSATSWAQAILNGLQISRDRGLADGRRFVLNGYRWEDAARRYVEVIRSVT